MVRGEYGYHRKKDWPKIYEEYQAGLSMPKLAKKYDCSKTIIRNHFIRLGYKIRTRKEHNFLRRGKNCGRWKGGRSIVGNGYIQVMVNGKAIREHHKVYCAANNLEKIPAGHQIHHIDKDKTNNDISNLKLMTKFAHRSLHSKEFAEKHNGLVGINYRGDENSPQ